jgi:hypothetical protein
VRHAGVISIQQDLLFEEKTMKAILLLLVSLMVVPRYALSEELPKYAGVYLEMDDGEYIEVPRMDLHVVDFWYNAMGKNVLRTASSFGKAILITDQNILNAPVVRYDRIKAIVSNFRNDEVTDVKCVVPRFQYFKKHEPEHERDRMGGMGWIQGFAYSTFGWSVANSFYTEYLDNFTTRITPKANLKFKRIERCSRPYKMDQSTEWVPNVGFAIQTEQDNLYLFFTDHSIKYVVEDRYLLNESVRARLRFKVDILSY